MVYSRRKHRSARKIQRFFRRRRRGRYKARGSQVSAKTGILTCYQHCNTEQVLSSTTAGSWTASNVTFSLSNVNALNVQAFQRLFKWFRILGVKATFRVCYSGGSTTDTATGTLGLTAGTVYTSKCFDVNDLNAGSWSSQEDAECESNMSKKYINLTSGGRATKVVKLRPRLNQLVYTGTSGVVTLGNKGSWISTDSPSCTYTGMKYGLEIPNPHPDMKLLVHYSYLLQFKGVQ